VRGKSELLFLPQAESKAATTHANFFVAIQVRKLINQVSQRAKKEAASFFYFSTPEE
jgi:hypothetical protein